MTPTERRLVWLVCRESRHYVMGVYKTQLEAEMALRGILDRWTDDQHRPITYMASCSHPLRWTTNNGEIFEISAHVVQPHDGEDH